jgi:hypothetical protein
MMPSPGSFKHPLDEVLPNDEDSSTKFHVMCPFDQFTGIDFVVEGLFRNAEVYGSLFHGHAVWRVTQFLDL